MYPILLIISFTPVTVLRFLKGIESSIPIELVIISGAFTCLNGFLNSMVYGYTQQVREAVFPSSLSDLVDSSPMSDLSGRTPEFK